MKSVKSTLVLILSSLTICCTANATSTVDQYIKHHSHNSQQHHYLTRQAQLFESIIVSPPSTTEKALNIDSKAMRNAHCLANSYKNDLVKTHKVLLGLRNTIFDSYADKNAYNHYSKLLENIERKTTLKVKC